MAEPANSIAGTAPRVVRLRDDAPGWNDLPRARRHARERRVARDLVELSRLQRGAERADCARLDLATLLRTICADYPQLQLRGPEHLPVCTDSRRLARVLFALLDNAYLHGAPPVSVHFDATEIIIQDGGPGFAAGLLPRATEPFATGARENGRGVGLGLAIAARQATVLGAALQLSNGEHGAVAVFRFAGPGGGA